MKFRQRREVPERSIPHCFRSLETWNGNPVINHLFWQLYGNPVTPHLKINKVTQVQDPNTNLKPFWFIFYIDINSFAQHWNKSVFHCTLNGLHCFTKLCNAIWYDIVSMHKRGIYSYFTIKIRNKEKKVLKTKIY